MTDFKVTDEAVEAYKRVYGQNYVDGKLLKVDDRITRAIEAALPVMFTPAGYVYTMEALVPGEKVKRHTTLVLPLAAGTCLYAIKEPK